MINYRNLSIITDREVYPPAEDSFLAAEVLEDQIRKCGRKELSILDMGTATGILGLCAAANPSVKRVVFADISQDAVRICKENVAFNSAVIKADCAVIQTDFFSKVNGKFDIITFNAPYLRNEGGDEKLGGIAKAVSGGREGIEVSVRFLEEAVSHIENGGRVLLVTSSLSNLKKLRSETARLNFRLIEDKKIHIFFEDIIVIVLVKRRR